MPDGKAFEAADDRTDWDRLRAMSDEAIERAAADDTDNPATMSDGEWAEAFVGVPPGRIAVRANFDSDVVAFFKRGGRGYQDRMNAVLRRYMEMRRGDGSDG